MEQQRNWTWGNPKHKKIYVINGSPHKNASGTLQVTKAFLKGIESHGNCTTEFDTLSDMSVKPCTGCFFCWGRNNGTCVINDDIPAIKQKILDADVIIGSYPLYFFSMPGTVKTLNDRLLSIMLPYSGKKIVKGEPFHKFRYDMHEKRFLLISTCGFNDVMPTYEPLLKQYDCIFGNDGYQALLCPQGEVFSNPKLQDKVDVYLEKYTAAGVEFAEHGVISAETIQHLQTPIFKQRQFELFVEKFWYDEIKRGE